MVTEQNIIDALHALSKRHDNKMVRRCEQLFRNESGHFKSQQFLIDLSPGMEAFSQDFPYGWSRLSDFWKANPQYAPIGITSLPEHTSALAQSRGTRRFLMFHTIDAAMETVCEDVRLLGGDFGAWFSTNPYYRAQYDKVLDTIVPRYCNSLGV